MEKPLYQEDDFIRECDLPNDEEPYRTAFRHDYARLLHSAAFRRLQGKTQLFPGTESDFFRNRLTHSLEVAQVAKSIALRLNSLEKSLSATPIDTDLVETAALAHDLGHPPFGHNGEDALDKCMKAHGGFEGNAQTLRILARLEKKKRADGYPLGIDDEGNDCRQGLGLCYRTLAAVLKYDRPIPLERRTEDALVKGYYESEKSLIKNIKKKLIGEDKKGALKTIECQIMDIADDIAYSTYDLEDALKGGFITPLNLVSASNELITNIAKKVNSTMHAMRKARGAPLGDDFTPSDASKTLIKIIAQQNNCLLNIPADYLPQNQLQADASDFRSQADVALLVGYLNRSAVNLSQNGYQRTEFTSALVGRFIHGLQFEYNSDNPLLSKVYLDETTLKEVEVLKHFTFESQIMSSRLKVVQYRGKEIVTGIFEALEKDDGFTLLPDDFRNLYLHFHDPRDKKRLICDFIAGMTDRYAVEFYERLKSSNSHTIYKPL